MPGWLKAARSASHSRSVRIRGRPRSSRSLWRRRGRARSAVSRSASEVSSPRRARSCSSGRRVGDLDVERRSLRPSHASSASSLFLRASCVQAACSFPLASGNGRLPFAALVDLGEAPLASVHSGRSNLCRIRSRSASAVGRCRRRRSRSSACSWRWCSVAGRRRAVPGVGSRRRLRIAAGGRIGSVAGRSPAVRARAPAADFATSFSPRQPAWPGAGVDAALAERCSRRLGSEDGAFRPGQGTGQREQHEQGTSAREQSAHCPDPHP